MENRYVDGRWNINREKCGKLENLFVRKSKLIVLRAEMSGKIMIRFKMDSSKNVNQEKCLPSPKTKKRDLCEN